MTAGAPSAGDGTPPPDAGTPRDRDEPGTETAAPGGVGTPEEPVVAASGSPDDGAAIAPAPGDTEGSLYERIGGAPQVEKLVERHYRRVLADPELAPFFEHTDMEKLRRMQHEFLATALGGPSTYTGRPLSQVHQGRGITKRHFTRFVEHLLQALESLGIDEDDVYAVIDRVAVQADEITGGFGEGG